MRPLLRGGRRGRPDPDDDSSCRLDGLDLGRCDRGGSPGSRRVITYDRRGYARSGGEPARSISTATADAAASSGVGVAARPPRGRYSAGAADRRWDPRGARRTSCGCWSPMSSQSGSAVSSFRLAARGAGHDRVLALRGRQSDAAETLLRSAYTCRDGGKRWDVSRGVARVGRENASAALARDFPNSSAGIRPQRSSRRSRSPLCVATARAAPPACSGSSERSPRPSPLRERIESKGPATPRFDAPAKSRAGHRRHRHL